MLLLLACTDYGYTLQERTDVFLQEPPSEVDILLVVDNSYSMAPYQARLAENFQNFIRVFVEADVSYHIGVVSTTLAEPVNIGDWDCTWEEIDAMPEDGELSGPLVIANGTPDAERHFADVVDVGVCGSGSEMGLHASWVALTDRIQDDTNLGFLREDAALSVIYVSDEEDSSPEPVWVYVNELRALKSPALGRDAVTLSALAAQETPNDCPAEVIEAVPGTRAIEAARLTGGVSADICEEDFSGIVEELSLNASRLRTRFELSAMPLVESIEVTVGEDLVPCGDWSYALEAGNDGVGIPTVVFTADSVPKSSTTLQIYYRYGDGEGQCSSS